MPRPSRFVILLSVALAACGGDAKKTSDTASASAPAVDLAKEEATIRDLDAKWLKAVQARDTATISAFYAASGLYMPAGGGAMRGPEGAHKGWAGLFAIPNVNLYFAPTLVEVAASGDMAMDVGTYTLTGDKLADKGKYVVVWRKYGDTWKVAADIMNSDGPAK